VLQPGGKPDLALEAGGPDGRGEVGDRMLFHAPVAMRGQDYPTTAGSAISRSAGWSARRPRRVASRRWKRSK
jgi:hypothetical protein